MHPKGVGRKKNPLSAAWQGSLPIRSCTETLPGASDTGVPVLFPPSRLQGCWQGSIPADFCSEVPHAAVGAGVKRVKPRAQSTIPGQPAQAGTSVPPSARGTRTSMAALTASPGAHNNCLCPARDVMGTNVLPPPAARPGDIAQRCTARTTEPRSRLLGGKGRCSGCCPSPARQAKGPCGAQPVTLRILYKLQLPSCRRGEVGAAASLAMAVSLSLVSPAGADQGQSRMHEA